MSKFNNFLGKSMTAVSKRSSLLMETSKIKSRIIALENRNESLEEELGGHIYRLWKEKASLQETVERICGEMAENEQLIKELRRQIQALREPVEALPAPNGVVCACGVINRIHAKYCAKCGTRLLIEEDKQDEPGAPQSEQDGATLP